MKEEKIPRAAKGRRFRLDCHTLPATTLRKVAAPASSGQTGLDASRKAQFSAEHMNGGIRPTPTQLPQKPLSSP